MKDRTVPRPVGKRILLLIVAFFLCAMLWLALRQPPALDPATPPPTPAPPARPAAGPDQAATATPPEAPPSHTGPVTPPPSVEDLGGGRFRVGAIEFDEAERTVTIPAATHMREGAVEYLLVSRQGKVHESVFVTAADAREIQVAALLLGVEPQRDLGPANAAAEVDPGGAVELWVEWDRDGSPARVPLHDAVNVAGPATADPAGNLPAGPWLYNGSLVSDGAFLASSHGSIISLIRDPEALVNNPGASRDNDDIHSPNAARLPELGDPVRIMLKVAPER